jgi:hypothetical protein
MGTIEGLRAKNAELKALVANRPSNPSSTGTHEPTDGATSGGSTANSSALSATASALFSGRLESIRRLRNRMFHHEPILRMRQLAQNHQDIQFILGLLGPDLQHWNTLHDRFHQGPEPRNRPWTCLEEGCRARMEPS